MNAVIQQSVFMKTQVIDYYNFVGSQERSPLSKAQSQLQQNKRG